VAEQSTDSTLVEIIRELLLDRTEGLDPARLAAFIDGWGSLLRLLERPELLIPGAPPELVEALAAVVGRIRAAQDLALEDDD
jgi:hypothetical protein